MTPRERARLERKWRPYFDTEADMRAFLVTEAEADRRARRSAWLPAVPMLLLAAWVLALVGRKEGWW